ncbi:MAG: class II fumarate hydratase [Pseudomonadota bacterium]|nr:class II fumarate hydratase [Burkholderiales bacterium]MDQ3197148.1 class II fumarate hydratase [Pseudomonadota bacterium]
MGEFRAENDSMGVMQVPVWALWGASTQRAIENFAVSGRAVPLELIHAYGLLKAACAKANRTLGKLDEARANAIIDGAGEIARGELDRHFVIDVFQTGSGTSTNTNVNEVIANRASQKAGLAIGSKTPLHPNDHVNLGQSSNDTFPAALHIAAALALSTQLVPALQKLRQELTRLARDTDGIVKIGRTHYMDATPIRAGQVFSGYAAQAENAIARANRAIDVLRELPIGGTAVGTGLNTHAEFGASVCEELTRATAVHFYEARNHFEAQAARDGVVEASGSLKTIAVSLSKIANDIRVLGSGPRCGIFELSLPATQPGSSIMPGKVNPVMCESVIQVAARVIGNDSAITYGGFGGVGSILELNVAMPLLADALLESIRLLGNVSVLFVDKLLAGLQVNRERCEALIEQSLMMVTSLAPALGYERAARLAQQAFAEGRTIRELAREQCLLDDDTLDALLDPRAMTEPGGGDDSTGDSTGV